MWLKASTARPALHTQACPEPSRKDGPPGFPPVSRPSRPVATGEIGERRGELLDRPAHTVGDQHQRQQRQEPCHTEQDEQRQGESAPQVA